jgi:hypothetical protein
MAPRQALLAVVHTRVGRIQRPSSYYIHSCLL